MPWYGWLILLCVIIGPFDALYLYIKSERRRDALRKKRDPSESDVPSPRRKR